MRTPSLPGAWLIAPALMSVAISSLDCTPCNAGLCTSRFVLVIEEPGHAPLQSGTYAFEIDVDGEAFESDCDVDADVELVSCADIPVGVLHGMVVADDDGRRTLMRLVFEEPDPLPQALSVKIVHDGVTVADHDLSPTYRLSEPGCDESCVDATPHFTLDR